MLNYSVSYTYTTNYNFNNNKNKLITITYDTSMFVQVGINYYEILNYAQN